MLRAKYIAAIILMICFCLPLSKCSVTKVDPVSSNPSQSTAEKQAVEAPGDSTVAKAPVEYEKATIIPARDFNYGDWSNWFLIMGFFWPLPVYTLQKRSEGKARIFLIVVELGLSAFTAWMLAHLLFVFYRPLPAGWVAAAACLTIVVGALHQPFAAVLSRIKNRG